MRKQTIKIAKLCYNRFVGYIIYIKQYISIHFRDKTERFDNKIAPAKQRLYAKLPSYYKSISVIIIYILEFTLNIFTYGMLINYIIWSMYIADFSIKNIICCGIVCYFIKEELKNLIIDIKLGKR